MLVALRGLHPLYPPTESGRIAVMRKAPPGEYTVRRGLHFAYTPTEANKPWTAYIAGPCWWLYGHCKGKTRPCLDWLTEGQLQCDHCCKGQLAELVGYQPLWRESDSKPVCVIVHEGSRAGVDSFKRPQPVTVCREGGFGDGVYFRKPLKPVPVFHAVMPEKLCDADVTESCLRFWKIPALSAWHLSQPGQKSGGVLHPPKEPFIPTGFAPANPTDPASSVGESIREQFPDLKANEDFVRRIKSGIGLEPPSE